MTVETSPHVVEKPPEHLTINNASSAADVAWGSLFSTPLNQIQSGHSRSFTARSRAPEKGEAERERKEEREQDTEHVLQNAEAAVLPMVV